MKAGFGKIDITPALGVELAGYGYYLGRRAARVTDPLFARALALEHENVRFMLVSCDLLGLNADICENVKSRLSAKGFQSMMVSIHTHTGPAAIYHEGCGYPNPEYVSTLADGLTRACELAESDMRDVSGLFGAYGKIADGFAYNRACPDGPVDKYVRGFVFKRRDARPVAVASYACHAVSRGRDDGISADYPGALMGMLDGSGYESMYINGLCGDIDPVVGDSEPRNEKLLGFARAIKAAFEQNLAPLDISLDAGRLSDTVRFECLTRDDISRSADLAAEKRVSRIWEREMLEKYDSLAFSEDVSTAYAILGGRLIAALPYEGFTRIGENIRSKLARPDAIILGCAEQLLGYLPTSDDIARGAYAALESAYLYKRLPVLAGEAERLSDALAEKLKSVLR